MNREAIWEEKNIVHSYETDFRNCWRPVGFFQALQDAASRHAEALGYGYDTLKNIDRAWVLSRMKIYFYAFPHSFDQVVIRTWPKGIQQKLFFLRDFQISATNGEKLASATSAWLVVQPSARRLLPAASLSGEMPDNFGKNEIAEILEKIKIPADMPEIIQATAGYGSVDQIGHVNNTRYVEWVCDCFPHSFYETHRLNWIQINYVNEVLFGEQISFRMKADNSDQLAYTIEGFNLSGGERACEVRMHWV